jgi:hypothetical protein
MTAQLIAIVILASISIAKADPIPVTYLRSQDKVADEGVPKGPPDQKPTPGLSAPYVGKFLSDISRIQRITVRHNYDKAVSDEVVRQKLPLANFLWIMDHYSVQAVGPIGYENIPNGVHIAIHYQNGFVLSVNTLEKTAYEGVLISPDGKYESVGFSYHGGK